MIDSFRTLRLLSCIALGASLAACGGSACPQGYLPQGTICVPFWGSVSGAVTLAGQQDSSGIALALLGTDIVATTDADGHFEMGPVAAGDYVVQARAPGYVAGRFAVTVVDGQGGKINGTLALSPGSTGTDGGDPSETGTISGNITLAGQSDSSGILILVLGTDRIASTGANGAFAVGGLPPGQYVVQAESTGFLPGQFPATVVVGQTATVHGELAPHTGDGGTVSGSGAVSGHAYLIGQTNHAGITVALSGGGSGTSLTTTTSADGAFRFGTVPVGVYSLRYSASSYASQNSPDVVVSAGTWQAQDVTLTPGSPFAQQPIGYVSWVPDGSKAIVVFGTTASASSFIYDVATATLTPLGYGSVIFRGAAQNGSVALVTIGSTLEQLDLDSGRLTPVSPPATAFVGTVGSNAYYTVSNGDVYTVPLSGVNGTLFLSPPVCSYLSGPSIGSLGTDEVLKHWFTLGWTAYCTNSNYNYISIQQFLHDSRPVNIGLSMATGTDLPDKVVLVQEPTTTGGWNGPTTLKRIDLATGTVTTLQTNVSAITIDSQWKWAQIIHDYDSTANSGTFASLEPKRGNVVDLVTNATAASSYYYTPPAGAGLVTTGTAGVTKVLRYDRGTVSLLCPTQGYLTGTFASLLVCQGYTSNGTYSGLTAYDYTTDTATLLNTAPFSNLRVTGSTVVWTEGNITRAFRARANGPQTLCTQSYYQSGISPDGNWLAYICGSSWKAMNLTTGSSFDVAGWTGNGSYSCMVSNAGNALCVVPSGQYGVLCLSSYCTLAANSSGRSTTTASYSTPYGIWSPDGTALAGFYLNNSGYGAVDFSGRPNIMTLPSSYGSTYSYYQAVGAHAAAVLYWGYNPTTMQNLSSGAVVTLSATPVTPTQLGSSDDYLVGDSIAQLGTATVVPLGTGITQTRISQDKTVLTYLDGATHNLMKYKAGQGVTTLEQGCQQYSVSTGLYLYFCGSSGASLSLVKLDAETGSVTTLVDNTTPSLTTIADGLHAVAFAGVSATAAVGEVMLVDLVNGSATDMGARATIPLKVAATSRRIAFSGLDNADNPALYVANMDGSELRQLGGAAQNLAFSQDGNRLLFDSRGVRWIEASGSHPPVALGRADGVGTTYLSPDDETMLFNEFVYDYPALTRNGAWALNVP